MTDDKVIEAALDAWWAAAQNDNATGVTAMRAALAAADKVRAEGFDFDNEIPWFVAAYQRREVLAFARRTFAAGLAKGEADRAALIEALKAAQLALHAAGRQHDALEAQDALALVRKGV